MIQCEWYGFEKLVPYLLNLFINLANYVEEKSIKAESIAIEEWIQNEQSILLHTRYTYNVVNACSKRDANVTSRAFITKLSTGDFTYLVLGALTSKVDEYYAGYLCCSSILPCKRTRNPAIRETRSVSNNYFLIYKTQVLLIITY